MNKILMILLLFLFFSVSVRAALTEEVTDKENILKDADKILLTEKILRIKSEVGLDLKIVMGETVESPEASQVFLLVNPALNSLSLKSGQKFLHQEDRIWYAFKANAAIDQSLKEKLYTQALDAALSELKGVKVLLDRDEEFIESEYQESTSNFYTILLFMPVVFLYVVAHLIRSIRRMPVPWSAGVFVSSFLLSGYISDFFKDGDLENKMSLILLGGIYAFFLIFSVPSLRLIFAFMPRSRSHHEEAFELWFKRRKYWVYPPLLIMAPFLGKWLG